MTWRDQTILDELTLSLLLAAAVSAALWSAGHALLHKRDPRSALVWVSLCLTLPLVGPAAYWLLGINRITRRALRWHGVQIRSEGMTPAGQLLQSVDLLPPSCGYLQNLEVLANRVVRTRARSGNLVLPLQNGEAAYPAMLEALHSARHSIHLCSYIFDGDGEGARFVAALAAAAERGVAVRVLVDAMGERYSRLTARAALIDSKVQLLPYLPLHKAPFINLRNHRKLLVVDGSVAFTGGMNIRTNHCLTAVPSEKAATDLHFKVLGPVVTDLQRIFIEDWQFASGSQPDDPHLFPMLDAAGSAVVRAIADGPDREFRKLEWLVMGALATAREQVWIMTPYFVPDRPMITALITAALRGVAVTIILPAVSNLPFTAWAARASYWELIKNGITVLEQPPPFAHTKLLLVDRCWSLIGSANFDTRSFRLNFELNLAVYDQQLAESLHSHCVRIAAQSKRFTTTEMDQRQLATKLRDAAARLFTPYL